MADSFKTFADKRKREVRVTFDQDGTAYYCGVDLAAMSGYVAPAKVVQTSETGSRPAKAVYRKIDCIDKNKRGVRRFRCFDEENALIFLDRKPAPPEVVTWFTNEVVPKVRQISLEMAAKRARDVQRELELMQEAPALEEKPAQLPVAVGSILERLDAIILECALLKRELCQTK